MQVVEVVQVKNNRRQNAFGYLGRLGQTVCDCRRAGGYNLLLERVVVQSTLELC